MIMYEKADGRKPANRHPSEGTRFVLMLVPICLIAGTHHREWLT